MNLVDAITRNWALKLTALGLAVGFWSVLKAEAPTRIAIPGVPVQVDVRDPAWTLAGPPDPAEVTVTFIGPARELLQLAVDRPRVILPVEDAQDSIEVRTLERRFVVLEHDLARSRIEEVRPVAVRVSLERIASRAVPIALRAVGVLPTGLELAGPLRVEPSAVRLSGPASEIAAVDSVRTAAIDLSVVSDTGSIVYEVDLRTVGLENLRFAFTRARVIVPVAAASADERP